MSLPTASQSWRMPDELWEKVKPFLPPSKPHPLGCHRPRVDDRKARELRNEMHIHLKRLYRPVQRCAFSGEGSVIPGPLRKQESHEKRSQAKMLMSYIVLCNPRALWLQEYIRSAIERREQLTGGQLLHTDDELHDIGDRSSYGQFHRRMRRWSYRNA